MNTTIYDKETESLSCIYADFIIVIGPANIDYLSAKKSPIFSVFALNSYLNYCNKIFITTAEFNELSSTAYRIGIMHFEWTILAKI